MNTQITNLRPGLLVSLKTSLAGNITYARTEIEPDHLTEVGTKEAAWETKRTISDPAEFEAATKVRSKALSIIRAVCAKSAFGLLCPDNAAEDLDKAVGKAKALVAEFNASAKLTSIGLYVIAGRIRPDDAEAVRAINSEIRDLLSTIEEGVSEADAAAIREAAKRAKSVATMLQPEAQARVQIAIDAGRKAASAYVKAGETASVEIDKAAIRKIAEMRSAFLDLDPIVEEAVAEASGAGARALDLEPEAPELSPAQKAAAARRAAAELVAKYGPADAGEAEAA